MLTLRKFRDLHEGGHLRLIDEDPEALAESAAILEECERRHTHRAANLLFAHYASGRTDAPLSSDDLVAIAHEGGWAEQEEFMEWLRPMIHRLCAIRDAIISRYGLPNDPMPPEDL